MKKIFQSWLKSRRERRQRIKDMDSDSRFYVQERNGSVWMVCDGIAIRKFPSDASNAEVVAELESAREFAKEFEREKARYYGKSIAG